MTDFGDILRVSFIEYQDKNERYEQRIATDILRALSVQGLAGLKKQMAEEFNLTYVNMSYVRTYSSAFECRKMPKALDLKQLLTKDISKTWMGRQLEEVKENWPDRSYRYLIFDYHGDGVGDLVLHNRSPSFYDKDSSGWVMKYGSGFDALYLQEWKLVLANLKEHWKET